MFHSNCLCSILFTIHELIVHMTANDSRVPDFGENSGN